MFRLISSLPLVFILITPSFANETTRTIQGFVTEVTAGDKITVLSYGTKLKMRLYGIDAPDRKKVKPGPGRESKPGQPYSEEAFQALKEKIDQRWIKFEIIAFDRHKRAVAILWCGNRNINREMVQEGHAWAYRKYLDLPHASEYLDAEQQAKTERLGLWQQQNPQPPWEFRQAMRQPGKEQDPFPLLSQFYGD